MTKIFKEDENNLPRYKKVERQTILAKLKINMPATEEELDPIELIKIVDEGFISDLRPEEIPDDCVSEVDATILETLEGGIDNAVMDA